MRLVVGLGNPGERYRRTRHNAGFLVTDELAALHAAGHGREECFSWVADIVVGGEPVLLVKPLTFMNRSGVAVDQLLADHSASPAEVWLYSDSDTAFFVRSFYPDPENNHASEGCNVSFSDGHAQWTDRDQVVRVHELSQDNNRTRAYPQSLVLAK